MKRQFFVCTLIICIISIFIGCALSKDDEDGCVSCGDTITWTSYGNLNLNSAGRDSTARDIISSCGWHVHNGHNGGYGDTLQIASCFSQTCPTETGNPSTTNIVEDLCISSSFIPDFPFRATGNTEVATTDHDEPNFYCAYTHGNSIWYYFEAVENGYISVSPLHLDLTNYRAIDKLRNWGLGE